MPVRQLHGYWDSAEFSSASRIAIEEKPPLFLCQRSLAHRYYGGASRGNGAHAQQKALVSI